MDLTPTEFWGTHLVGQLKLGAFRFVLGMSLAVNDSRRDLSEAEARTILSAGLALMPVQHVARDGWSPSKALGTVYGRNAAANTLSIGFPPGINVWLDLEGVKPSISHRIVIDYCNAWFAEVASAGFAPGIYIGARAVLPARRSSGDFRPRIFGDPEARSRTSLTGAIK